MSRFRERLRYIFVQQNLSAEISAVCNIKYLACILRDSFSAILNRILIVEKLNLLQIYKIKCFQLCMNE